MATVVDPTREVGTTGGSAPSALGVVDAGDPAIPTPPRDGARPSAEGGDDHGSAGGGGADPPRPPRPWSTSVVLASAAGEEGGTPSFGDLIRYHGRLLRERGKAEYALGRLTVERDALRRQLDELAPPSPMPDHVVEAPPEAGVARWPRWLVPTLLGLLLLIAIAWWALDWPTPWEGGGGDPVPTAPSVTAVG